MSEPLVLAVGETMVQLTPSELERLSVARELRVDIGGAESNLACHLVREGVPAAWAGAVGDDPFGRRVHDTVAARGVDVSLVAVDPTAPTAVYAKDPSPEGTRVHYYRRGSAAALLGPAFAARLPLASVPWVHLSGILPALSASCDALVDAILDQRQRHGLPVSFDVNWRPALWSDPIEAGERLAAIARRCSLVFVGLDEARALWETDSPEAVRSQLGCAALVVKDEGRGAWAWLGDDTAVVVPEPVEVVEPVGAGDAFAAGFLAGHLRGESAERSLRAGHRRAAAVLAVAGDYDEQPEEQTMPTTTSDEKFERWFAATRALLIVRGLGPEATLELAERAWDAGLTMLEIPCQTALDEETLRFVTDAADARGLVVGAGTVIDVAQVARVSSAGAAYIVSPGLDRDVIAAAQAADLAVLPGVATPSEIQAVTRLGLHWVKVFPAAALGVDWVAAMQAPFPGVRMVATGGIDRTNADAFLDAGASVLSFGSSVVREGVEVVMPYASR